MNNQFDTANYPEGIPTTLTVGTYWAWNEAEVSSVYPVASYTLVYRINLQVAPFNTITLTADKSTGSHVIESSDNTEVKAGEYNWQASVKRDSDSAEVVVSAGLVTINPCLSDPGDTRSWAVQVLQAVRETIKGTASREISSYTIGGRSLAARTPAELVDLEKEFSKRVRQEQAAAGKKRKRVLVGMGA